MPKLKLYLSSTFLDLERPRAKILAAIQTNFHKEFELMDVMELMRGDGENRSNIDFCRDNVRGADVYILLVGKRLGSAPVRYSNDEKTVVENTEEKSYTQLEYEAACATGRFKRYHIYKLELTDAFFVAEDLDPKNDLTNEGKKARYAKFREQLDETGSTRPLNDANELNQAVNTLLTESFIIFNTILQLKISEEEQCSIDRTPQVAWLERDFRKIQPQTNVVSFLLNTRNSEEDQTDLFSKKIRKVLRPFEDREINRKLCWVDVNLLAQTYTEDVNKIMDLMLVATSSNILGATADFITFDRLPVQLEKNNVQNRFFGFLVDLTSGDELVKTFVRYIQLFVQKMQDLLSGQGFSFRFYFIICIVTEKELKSSDFLTTYAPEWKTECYNLGRLSPVEFSDIDKWLRSVISSKNDELKQHFANHRLDIIKQIFRDASAFPKTYKECLADIHSRTN